MAKTVGTRVLEAAKRDLGVVEIPMGSNSGPRVEEMQNQTWFAGTTGWPWCVAAAWGTWLWQETLTPATGLRNPYPTASVEQLEAWARQNGWTAQTPRPGDLACLHAGEHVTVVEKVGKDGTFVGIGGNQGNMVKRTTYSLSSITTVVRPPARIAAQIGHTAPVWEVVRGEGEKARVVFRSTKLNAAVNRSRKLLKGGAHGLRIRKVRNG